MTKQRLRLATFAVAALAVCGVSAEAGYNETILADRPVMFLTMDTAGTGAQSDASGHGLNGTYVGGVQGTATLPNGEHAAIFNGSNQYLTVPHNAALSVPTNKALTVESWIQPGTLQFAHTEAEGYVYFLGKGDPSNGYEYANRMYSKSNSASRPNRISTYDWNTSGGLGSGAYFQDAVSAGEWIHVVDVIDMNSKTIAIYKNGVLRGRVALSQYSVTPGVTNSPFNVGTRNKNSWFQGAIGKVAVYNYVLSDARIAAHYQAMKNPSSTPSPVGSPAPTSPTPSPVAYQPPMTSDYIGRTGSAPAPAPSAQTGTTAAATGSASANAISAVKAAATTTGATITWNTTTVSHSQVEYGLSASYGAHTNESTATGLYHSSAMAGLKTGTTYHYRVKSRDASGRVAVSGDFTLRTAGTTAAAR